MPPRRTTFKLLALLGVAQLAIPCLLAVRLSRELPARPRSCCSACSRCWRDLGQGSALANNRRRRRADRRRALVIGALLANELG